MPKPSSKGKSKASKSTAKKTKKKTSKKETQRTRTTVPYLLGILLLALIYILIADLPVVELLAPIIDPIKSIPFVNSATQWVSTTLSGINLDVNIDTQPYIDSATQITGGFFQEYRIIKIILVLATPALILVVLISRIRAKKKNGKSKGKQHVELLKEPLGRFEKFGLAGELTYLIDNVSALTGAGIGVISAFESIEKELRTIQMKRVVKTIIHDLRNGNTLWSSMKKTGVFDISDIEIIHIGEETGQLPQNLKVVSMQNRKNSMFRSKIKSALLYPVLVLSIAIIVALGTAWFILPKLARVFDQMRIELPLLTRIVIGIGKFFGEHGVIAVPSIIALLSISLYLLFMREKSKHIGQAILFRTPGVGRLIREIEIARFGYLLGLLINSGIPIMQALSSFGPTAELRPYKELYLKLTKDITRGSSFQKSFASDPGSIKLIPSPIQQMIVAGEQSGKLGYMLTQISEIYENKSEVTTKNLTVILEPLLLIVVWLGVLGLAIAVITPIYGLLQGLR
jgi:type IV pilus assembly protein PilC